MGDSYQEANGDCLRLSGSIEVKGNITAGLYATPQQPGTGLQTLRLYSSMGGNAVRRIDRLRRVHHHRRSSDHPKNARLRGVPRTLQTAPFPWGRHDRVRSPLLNISAPCSPLHARLQPAAIRRWRKRLRYASGDDSRPPASTQTGTSQAGYAEGGRFKTVIKERLSAYSRTATRRACHQGQPLDRRIFAFQAKPTGAHWQHSLPSVEGFLVGGGPLAKANVRRCCGKDVITSAPGGETDGMCRAVVIWRSTRNQKSSSASLISTPQRLGPHQPRRLPPRGKKPNIATARESGDHRDQRTPTSTGAQTGRRAAESVRDSGSRRLLGNAIRGRTGACINRVAFCGRPPRAAVGAGSVCARTTLRRSPERTDYPGEERAAARERPAL